MKKIRRKKLFEDDTTSNSNQQSSSNSTSQSQNSNMVNSNEVTSVRQQILQLETQIQQEYDNYINKKSNYMKQIIQLNKKLVSLGYNSSSSIEKLAESEQTNKQDELSALIEIAFSKLPNISYSLDKNGCKRLARKIIEYLNSQNWNDGKDHWNDVLDYIKQYFLKIGSFSRRELIEIGDKIKNVILMADFNGFDWIFGPNKRKKIII